MTNETENTTLSDKIFDASDGVGIAVSDVVFAEDIKQTNKKILEKLLGYQYHSNPALNEYCLNHIKKVFKSEMGKELTE